MIYVLLNRNNLVIDILNNSIRYIKLQPSNGLVIGCEKEEGTGVIGSDCNTHYTLIKADTQNNPDSVRILELEEIPSNVKPLLFKWDTETGTFIYRYTLEEAQNMKQEENKKLFSNYLDTHPLTWKDGKTYGVTMEDQSEISFNINQYQIAFAGGVESPPLEWHAKHEKNTPWALDQLVALSMDISDFVYPIYHKMQEYKTAIFNTSTHEELDKITLTYE